MTGFEVRVHGRGGQGAVTAAELLSVAAFLDGHEAQAFPSFGSERTGAPVAAFCRVSDSTIRTREPVMAPSAVVVLDPTLLHHVDVFAGLSEEGFVVINAAEPFAALGLDDVDSLVSGGHAVTVPASEISRDLLGRPLPNVGVIAGLAALTRVVTLTSVLAAIDSRFSPGVAARNRAVAQRCFELVSDTTVVSADA